MKRQIEELRSTNLILEDKIIKLQRKLSKFDYKNRKRDESGRFAK